MCRSLTFPVIEVTCHIIPFVPLSKNKHTSHLLAFALLCFFKVAKCQDFPESWLGHYRGKMNLTNLKNNHSSIAIRLEINTVIPDSAWSYYMCYLTPHDTLIKDYQIKKISENQYLMDEGSIEIPMYFANGCFYDFYTIDSMYFTSVLTKVSRKKIAFNLYGGKLNASEQRISLNDETTVVGYLPTFSQCATLIRRRKY
jgi:hypothetical protein